MKSVLLIGLGRFGKSVAEKLNEIGAQVLAVDKDEDKVNAVLDLVTGAQIGDSSNEAFLKNIGVDHFDVCIVAIGEDFKSSLETTSLLKELGAKKVVSRAYSDVHRKFLLNNGADEVVYPEEQLGNWTAVKYSYDQILDFIELDGDFSIYEVVVPQEWYGKTVEHLNIRKRFDLNLLAIRVNGSVSMPVTAETVFGECQTVLVLGKLKDVHRCFKL